MSKSLFLFPFGGCRGGSGCDGHFSRHAREMHAAEPEGHARSRLDTQVDITDNDDDDDDDDDDGGEEESGEESAEEEGEEGSKVGASASEASG